MAAAIGDFTGDGRNDVAMSTGFYYSSRRDFRVWLFRQKPDGTLRDPVRYPTDLAYGDEAGMSAGDLDGDGETDLALATSAGVDIFWQRDGKLSSPVLLPIGTDRAGQVFIIDVIGGRRAELVVNTHHDVRIYKNVNGTFQPRKPIVLENTGVKVADVTNDGLPNLVANDGSTVYVRAQTARGPFAPAVSYTTTGAISTKGLEVADVTNDGLADVIVTFPRNSPNSAINIFPGEASGTLAAPVRYPSYEVPDVVASVDLGGDGRSDIVTLHGGWLEAGVYLQAEDATLTAEQLVPIPDASHYNLQGLALGDVNDDGKADIVFADRANGLVVLRQA